MYRKKVFTFIIVFTLLRILAATFTQLGNDEAYYYTYALHLQWNYFDHPPGVAILIKIFTLNLWLQNEFFLRLGSIVCAIIASFLCYYVGRLIKNERTGLFAVILYNTCIYTSIIAGTFILPDSPQMIFWLGSLFMFCKIVIAVSNNKSVSTSTWMLAGLLSGLTIMCKVHGIFLWIGFGIYVLFFNRKLLADWRLYASAIITCIIISPIFLWNMQNHFITYTYHSGRVEVHQLLFNINTFIQAFFGQILYNNPVNVVLILIALFNLKKTKFKSKHINPFLFYTGLPIIIMVTIISMFDQVLPHWSGPGFLTLSFIAAAWLDEKAAFNKSLPASLKASAIIIVAAIIGGVVLINYYPGTIGKKDNANLGSNDFTLDMFGWKDFENQFAPWFNKQENTGALDKNISFVCNKWFTAAHEEYYVTRPLQKNMIGVGTLDDLHTYAWLNKIRTPLKVGDSALCIIPSNYNIDVTHDYKDVFESFNLLKTFTVYRSGQPAKYYYVYLLKNYTGKDELHNIEVN